MGPFGMEKHLTGLCNWCNAMETTEHVLPAAWSMSNKADGEGRNGPYMFESVADQLSHDEGKDVSFFRNTGFIKRI